MIPVDHCLMTHAIAAIDAPGDKAALCSFADHLAESAYENDPWVEWLLLYLKLGDDLDHDLDLLNTSIYQATTESEVGDCISDGTYSILLLQPHSFPAVRIGRKYITSWLPMFAFSYRTCKWRRRMPRQVVRSNELRNGGTDQYVVYNKSTVNSMQVVYKLLADGGIGSLVHGLIGVHYFACPVVRGILAEAD